MTTKAHFTVLRPGMTAFQMTDYYNGFCQLAGAIFFPNEAGDGRVHKVCFANALNFRRLSLAKQLAFRAANSSRRIDLTEMYRKIAAGEQIDTKPQAVAEAEERLKEYMGKYAIQPNLHKKWRDNSPENPYRTIPFVQFTAGMSEQFELAVLQKTKQPPPTSEEIPMEKRRTHLEVYLEGMALDILAIGQELIVVPMQDDGTPGDKRITLPEPMTREEMMGQRSHGSPDPLRVSVGEAARFS